MRGDNWICLVQDHKGRFLHDFIPMIWNSYDKALHTWLLQLTEEFDLTFPLPKDNVNIVPCLLPQEEPEEVKVSQRMWRLCEITECFAVGNMFSRFVTFIDCFSCHV